MHTKYIVLCSLRLGQPLGPRAQAMAVAHALRRGRARPPRKRSNGGAHQAPQGGSPYPGGIARDPPPHLLARCLTQPPAGYTEPGFATDAASAVAPALTALAHHAHAPTTHTTTQAAPSDRHPLSEGTRPSTGMQGYLPQATIAASEPRRSSDASAGMPKHARQQGQTSALANRRAPPARTSAAAGLFQLWRR